MVIVDLDNINIDPLLTSVLMLKRLTQENRY